MTYIQCSMCFKTYSFNDWIKLKHDWIDPKKKKYGKTAICTCGVVFHKNQWAIQTRKDLYTVSTVHLEIAHGTSSIFSRDHSQDYFYETMIFLRDQLKEKDFGKPLDFMMRYKTMEEAIRGHKDTIDKLEMIILNPGKYPMGILSSFANMIGATEDQRKNIHPSVKKRLV